MSHGETGQSGDDSPAVTLGKITAQPNPLPFDMSVPLTLRWETNASEAEVYVAEDGAPEKLLTRGKFGSREVNWIPAGRSYCFRLYTGSDRQLLDEVVVDVAAIPWRKLLERVKGAPKGREYTDGLAEFIGGVLPGCLRRPEYPAWFRRWENSGVHVTPVQFYEPIPDSRTLKDELWTQVHELVGIDMNEPMQLHLLKEICPRFQEECDRIPMDSAQAGNGFYLKNGHFQSVDPLVAYCLVRHFRPRQIIEVGGGYSTLLLALAARKNGTTALRTVEPYPVEFLTKGVDGLAELLPDKVEDLPLSYFSELEENDCLFIDTSHVIRIGGDVNYIFLEVLPRLKPGVIVHIHDIFFPFDYPKVWVIERRRFWTEQYLLQAFLTCNSDFQVLLSNSYLSTFYPEELESVFPRTSSPREGGSFWMRRKPLNSS